MGDVYATYISTFILSMFLPYEVLNWFQSISTRPFTLAFSNTPGLLRPLQFDGRKSIKMQTYIIPAGLTGICLSCISYSEWFKIGCVVDEAVMTDPQTLVDMLEENLKECIRLGFTEISPPSTTKS